MRKNFLLLSGFALILLSACQKDKQQNKKEKDLYKDSPSSVVPEQLLHSVWFYGTLSAISYWDRDGHELGNDYEAGREYQFEEVNGQGRLKFWQYLGTRTASSCVNEYYTYKEGTVKFEDDVLTFYPVKGDFKTIKKGCSAGNGTTQRTAGADDLKPDTYRWELKAVDDRNYLYTYLMEDEHHSDPVFVYQLSN